MTTKKMSPDISWVNYSYNNSPSPHGDKIGRTGPTDPAERPKNVAVQVQAAMDQQGPLGFLAVPEFHACEKVRISKPGME